jgi:hypothetical protein
MQVMSCLTCTLALKVTNEDMKDIRVLAKGFPTQINFRATLKLIVTSCFNFFAIQCPPLNRITSGRHKSDNNNRMIQLTDVFCALSIYDWASNI